MTDVRIFGGTVSGKLDNPFTSSIICPSICIACSLGPIRPLMEVMQKDKLYFYSPNIWPCF